VYYYNKVIIKLLSTSSVMLNVHKCFVVRSLCHVCGANTSDVAGSIYVCIGIVFIHISKPLELIMCI